MCIYACESLSCSSFDQYRLSDATGKMTFSSVAEGNFSKSLLDPKDGKCHSSATEREYNITPYFVVFIVDSGKEVFVWIGNGTTKDEKRNAMPYAHVSLHLCACDNLILSCCFALCVELFDEECTSSCSCNLLDSGKRNKRV